MSVTFTSPTKKFPLRGAMARIRSGVNTFFGRRITLLTLAAASAGMVSSASIADEAFPLEGYWLAKGGQSIVEIAPCGKSHKRLCGKVVWSSAEGIAIGDTVLQSFRMGGNLSGDKWDKGKVFAAGAKKGKAGKLSLSGDNLKVSSCKGARCKSATWTRPSAAMTAEAGLPGGAE